MSQSYDDHIKAAIAEYLKENPEENSEKTEETVQQQNNHTEPTNQPASQQQVHWTKILNSCSHLPKVSQRYLRTMQDCGVVLQADTKDAEGANVEGTNVEDADVAKGLATFRPGTGLGWEHNSFGELDPEEQLRGIVTVFWTNLVVEMAKEVGDSGGDGDGRIYDALKVAIEAGGSIRPGGKGAEKENKLRFYWDRVPKTEEGKKNIALARKMLDAVSYEVMGLLVEAGRTAVKAGINVG